MDVILFFARRPGARGGAFVFLLDTRLPRVIERAMAVQLAAETAAQAKSRHIAFVSHEIRNRSTGSRVRGGDRRAHTGDARVWLVERDA